jgi:hypothetical protein
MRTGDGNAVDIVDLPSKVAPFDSAGIPVAVQRAAAAGGLTTVATILQDPTGAEIQAMLQQLFMDSDVLKAVLQRTPAQLAAQIQALQLQLATVQAVITALEALLPH